MNGQVQSSRVARCRQLKKEGMTIKGISEKCHISVPTVGRYVKGMVDQREKREMQTRTVSPTFLNNEVRNTRNADQDSISHNSHISHISQGVDTNADQDSISHNSRISQGVDTNIDQDSISHISQGRGKSNIGVSVLLFLGLTILILVLLDRFVFEGKIFAWVFGELKLQGQDQGTERKVESIGFEGRSIDEL